MDEITTMKCYECGFIFQYVKIANIFEDIKPKLYYDPIITKCPRCYNIVIKNISFEQ